MSNLSLSAFKKREWRADVLYKKISDGSPFFLSDSSERILQLGDVKDVFDKSFRLYDLDGNVIKLSQLVKTTEFGGQTKPLDKEMKALDKLRTNIRNNLIANVVPILFGNTVIDVHDVQPTKGFNKSDFTCLDKFGNPVAWISHKDGSKPCHFQQWSGISKREERIHNNSETQSFIEELLHIYPDGVSNTRTHARKISNTVIKMLSVYGSEYGSNNSDNNVNLVIQGTPNLLKTGNVYTITAHHILNNGDPVLGSYEPQYYMAYRSNYNNCGLQNGRLSITPTDGKIIKSYI